MYTKEVKKGILVLRIAETILLVGIVIELWVPDNQLNFGFLTLGFNFWIGVGGTRFLISSKLLGYVASVVATIWQWKSTSSALKYFSIMLGILGLLSYMNMLVRLVAYYPLSFFFDFAVILVIDAEENA